MVYPSTNGFSQNQPIKQPISHQANLINPANQLNYQQSNQPNQPNQAIHYPDHIDVYHYLAHTVPQYNLSFKQVQLYLAENFGFDGTTVNRSVWQEWEHEAFLKFPPKTYQYVPYLKELGFNNSQIAEKLGITKQSVSNAFQKSKLLSNTKRNHKYFNPRLRAKLMQQEYDTPEWKEAHPGVIFTK